MMITKMTSIWILHVKTSVLTKKLMEAHLTSQLAILKTMISTQLRKSLSMLQLLELPERKMMRTLSTLTTLMTSQLKASSAFKLRARTRNT
jgi:hypothetical protein